MKEKLAAEDVELFGTTDEPSGLMQDAINALRTLGLTQSEAVKAVEPAMKEASTLEDVIRCALRRINS